MKLKICFFIILSLAFLDLEAQVTIGSPLPANKGSLLDIKEYTSNSDNANSTKGLLLPRVLLNNATEFETVLSGVTAQEKESHVGLMVYHVGSVNLCAGVYAWDGSQWVRASSDVCTVSMDCGSVKINGTYSVGVALSALNTITLTLNVTNAVSGGTYNIYTDTQNGMRFSGTGTLVKGTQNIVLQGTGAPQSGGVTTQFTISFAYSNAVASPSSCTVSMGADVLPIARGGIFGFGFYEGTYGYHVESSASKAMLNASSNFGTNADSKVKSDGFTFTPTVASDGLTQANFLNSVGWKSDPDIIVNGYHSNINSGSASDRVILDSLVNYLNRGGVLILFDEYVGANNITLQLCKKLFPIQAASITSTGGGAAGYSYQIPTTVADDDITTGPFGSIKGLAWGEDASTTFVLKGLPADSIVVYTTNRTMSGTGDGTGVTMFRHKRLNLFWVGDGGFLSNPSSTIGIYPSTTICPFAVNSSYTPIPRTGWGSGVNGNTVHNSQIFGNIMYWAVKNARSNKRK